MGGGQSVISLNMLSGKMDYDELVVMWQPNHCVNNYKVLLLEPCEIISLQPGLPTEPGMMLSTSGEGEKQAFLYPA